MQLGGTLEWLLSPAQFSSTQDDSTDDEDKVCGSRRQLKLARFLNGSRRWNAAPSAAKQDESMARVLDSLYAASLRHRSGPCALLQDLCQQLCERDVAEHSSFTVVSTSGCKFALAAVAGAAINSFPPTIRSAPNSSTSVSSHGPADQDMTDDMDADADDAGMNYSSSGSLCGSPAARMSPAVDDGVAEDAAEDDREVSHMHASTSCAGPREFTLYSLPAVFATKHCNWSVEDALACKSSPFLFYDCTSKEPGLPKEAVWLMRSGLNAMVSLPCRYNGRVCGVLTLGTSSGAFSKTLLHQLVQWVDRITPFVYQAAASTRSIMERSPLKRFQSTNDLAAGLLDELVNLDRRISAPSGASQYAGTSAPAAATAAAEAPSPSPAAAAAQTPSATAAPAAAAAAPPYMSPARHAAAARAAAGLLSVPHAAARSTCTPSGPQFAPAAPCAGTYSGCGSRGDSNERSGANGPTPLPFANSSETFSSNMAQSDMVMSAIEAIEEARRAARASIDSQRCLYSLRPVAQSMQFGASSMLPSMPPTTTGTSRVRASSDGQSTASTTIRPSLDHSSYAGAAGSVVRPSTDVSYPLPAGGCCTGSAARFSIDAGAPSTISNSSYSGTTWADYLLANNSNSGAIPQLAAGGRLSTGSQAGAAAPSPSMAGSAAHTLAYQQHWSMQQTWLPNGPAAAAFAAAAALVPGSMPAASGSGHLHQQQQQAVAQQGQSAPKLTASVLAASEAMRLQQQQHAAAAVSAYQQHQASVGAMRAALAARQLPPHPEGAPSHVDALPPRAAQGLLFSPLDTIESQDAGSSSCLHDADGQARVSPSFSTPESHELRAGGTPGVSPRPHQRSGVPAASQSAGAASQSPSTPVASEDAGVSPTAWGSPAAAHADLQMWLQTRATQLQTQRLAWQLQQQTHLQQEQLRQQQHQQLLRQQAVVQAQQAVVALLAYQQQQAALRQEQLRQQQHQHQELHSVIAVVDHDAATRGGIVSCPTLQTSSSASSTMASVTPPHFFSSPLGPGPSFLHAGPSPTATGAWQTYTPGVSTSVDATSSTRGPSPSAPAAAHNWLYSLQAAQRQAPAEQYLSLLSASQQRSVQQTS